MMCIINYSNYQKFIQSNCNRNRWSKRYRKSYC